MPLSFSFIHHKLDDTTYYTMGTLLGLSVNGDHQSMSPQGRRLFDTANYNSRLYGTLELMELFWYVFRVSFAFSIQHE